MVEGMIESGRGNGRGIDTDSHYILSICTYRELRGIWINGDGAIIA